MTDAVPQEPPEGNGAGLYGGSNLSVNLAFQATNSGGKCRSGRDAEVRLSEKPDFSALKPNFVDPE